MAARHDSRTRTAAPARGPTYCAAVTVAERAGTRRRRLALPVVLVAGLAVAALLLAGLHLVDQHRHYGTWAWSAASPTPALPFRERDYVRGTTTRALEPGDVRVGTTWDGLPIWARPSGSSPPTAVRVQVGPTEYVGYSLLGGP